MPHLALFVGVDLLIGRGGQRARPLLGFKGPCARCGEAKVIEPRTKERPPLRYFARLPSERGGSETSEKKKTHLLTKDVQEEEKSSAGMFGGDKKRGDKGIF